MTKKKIDWTVEVMKHLAWRDFYGREMKRQETMETVRAAFIKARSRP